MESFEVRFIGVEIVAVNVKQSEQVTNPQNKIKQSLLLVIWDHDVTIEESFVQTQRCEKEVEVLHHVHKDNEQKEDHHQSVIVESDSLFFALPYNF